MAFDFPASPTVGQEYTSGSVTFIWNGNGWTVKASVDPSTVVKKSGDTMTGDLEISKVSPLLLLRKSAAAQYATLAGYSGAGATGKRWEFILGNDTAESGGDAGSNFSIERYSDTGAWLGSALAIQRKDSSLSGSSLANAAEYRGNIGGNKILTPEGVWSAAQFIALSETGATFVIDFATGFDFAMWPSVSGRTVVNPVNGKQGQKGLFIFNNNGAISTINWGTSYKFPGGVKPTLTVAAGAIDVVSYTVWDDNIVLCTFAADFK